MVKPASLSRLTGSITCLALLVGGTSVFAQQTKPVDDEKAESEEAVFIPVEYRPPPYQVSVGVRLAGKATVKFSGLGAIPSNTYPGASTTADDSTKAYGRGYADGSVSPDYKYSISSADDATTTTYAKVESTDGKTNYWTFTNANQVVDYPSASGGKALALHAYSVSSTGDAAATAETSRNSSIAWDLEVSRELGSNRRMSWGILLGAGISNISCETSATIKAKLHTLTDYYSLEGITFSTNSTTGAIVPVSYTGSTEAYLWSYKLADDGTPTSTIVYQYDSNGKKIKYWPTTQRISTDPIAGSRTDIATDIDVVGLWEVRGAYMTARFGPYFAYQLSRHFAVRASAGFTFTIIGASLRLDEKALIPATGAYLELNNLDYNLDSKINGILGYFASCELDAFLTERTGMFFGATHEGFQRDFTLQYYNQKADISISTGTVLRTGITTRF